MRQYTDGYYTIASDRDLCFYVCGDKVFGFFRGGYWYEIIAENKCGKITTSFVSISTKLIKLRGLSLFKLS